MIFGVSFFIFIFTFIRKITLSVTYTKCYLYQMLSIQNVILTKCNLYEMLPIQSVLYEMLPRQNVTIQNVTDLKPTKGS